MSKLPTMIGVSVLFAAACVFVPVAVSANSSGGSQSWHGPKHGAPFHRHHRVPRYYWYAPRYYVEPEAYVPPAPPPPPVQEHVTEVRRECEPRTYSVPTSSGGESQVTVIRC